MPWARAMDVVVFPEPAGMPEVAVTRMSLPVAFLSLCRVTLALSRPYGSNSSSARPQACARSSIRVRDVDWAISMSLNMDKTPND